MLTLRRSILVALTVSLLLGGCSGNAATETPPTAVTEESTAPDATSAEPVATAVAATEPAAPIATEMVVTEVPAATPTTESATAPEMPSLAPADAVRAAVRAQLSGGPYHVESTLDTDSFTLSADVIPPDQMSSTLTMEDGSTTQIIITGGQMWLNHGDGWGEPMSGEMVTSAISQMVMDPESADIQFSNEQFAGVDAVNGSPTWVYTYTTTFGSGEQAIVSNSRLWVEIATGLPVKLEGTATVMGAESTTTQTITYDDSITISPPQ